MAMVVGAAGKWLHTSGQTTRHGSISVPFQRSRPAPASVWGGCGETQNEYRHHTGITGITQKFGTGNSPAGGVFSWLIIRDMWIAMLRPRRHRADRNSPWTAGLCGADAVPFFSLSSSPLVPHMAESDQGILWPAPDQQFNIVRDGAWTRLVAGSGLTRCSGLKSDDANLVFPLSADQAGSFISFLSRGGMWRSWQRSRLDKALGLPAPCSSQGALPLLSINPCALVQNFPSSPRSARTYTHI